MCNGLRRIPLIPVGKIEKKIIGRKFKGQVHVSALDSCVRLARDCVKSFSVYLNEEQNLISSYK